jgi:hypothetical protein
MNSVDDEVMRIQITLTDEEIELLDVRGGHVGTRRPA